MKATYDDKLFIAELIEDNRKVFICNIKSSIPSADSQDIEDCIGELFTLCCEHFDSLSRSENKIGWLFNALKNITHTYLRKKKRFRTESLDDISDLTNDEKPDDKWTDDIVIKGLSKSKLIERALSDLSETEMKIYNLKYVEREDNKSISIKLNMPEGSVRRHLHYISQKVRKRIYRRDFFDK